MVIAYGSGFPKTGKILVFHHDAKTLEKLVKNVDQGEIIYWDINQNITEENFPAGISWVAISNRFRIDTKNIVVQLARAEKITMVTLEDSDELFVERMMSRFGGDPETVWHAERVRQDKKKIAKSARGKKV